MATRRTKKPRAPLPIAWLYAAGLQCTAAALVFFLTAVVKLPVLLYFPLSRRWSLIANPDELSMDFYGRSLLALGAGLLALVVTLAVFAVGARLSRSGRSGALLQQGQNGSLSEPQANRLALIAGYAVTALLLSILIYAYELYGRAPVPEPLPAGSPPIQKLPGPAPASSPSAGMALPP